MNKRINYLVIIIFVILFSIPWLMFYKEEKYNGYFLTVNLTSPIEYYLQEGHFSRLLNISGNWFLISYLKLILNVPVKDIQYWPIASTLISMSLFSLAHYLFKSNLLSVLIALLTLYYSVIVSPADWSIFVHGWGVLFYICFLYLLLKSKENRLFLIPLLLVFISNHFIDYTAEMWMIVTFLIYELTTIYNAKTNARYKVKKICFVIIMFAMMGFFFVSRKVVNENINKFSLSNIFSSVINLTASLIATKSITYNYQYTGRVPIIISITNLIPIIILVFVFLTAFYHYIKKLLSKNERAYLPSLQLALLGTLFTEMIVYSAYGLLRIGFLVWFYAFLLTTLFNNIDLNKNSKDTKKARKNFKILICVLSILLIINVTNFGYRVKEHLFPRLSQTPFWSSAGWLLHQTDNKIFILSDLTTLGKFKQYEIYAKLKTKNITGSFDFIYYDSVLYGYVIGFIDINDSNIRHIKKIKYIPVDEKSEKGTYSVGWRIYQPLIYYSRQIKTNYHLSRIYSDNRITIYYSDIYAK